MYLPEYSNDLRKHGATKVRKKLPPIYKQKIGLHAAVSSVTQGGMNSVYFIHQIHHELLGIMFDSQFLKLLVVAVFHSLSTLPTILRRNRLSFRYSIFTSICMSCSSKILEFPLSLIIF
jgi:hypothetical protein